VRYDLDLIAQPPVLNRSASLASTGSSPTGIHNDQANFGPRLGVAWTPLGKNWSFAQATVFSMPAHPPSPWAPPSRTTL